MNATIVDLRYHMKEVLEALDRNEDVHVFYHGKEKGVLAAAKGADKIQAALHPFFGSRKRQQKTVTKVMDELRGARYQK